MKTKIIIEYSDKSKNFENLIKDVLHYAHKCGVDCKMTFIYEEKIEIDGNI